MIFFPNGSNGIVPQLHGLQPRHRQHTRTDPVVHVVAAVGDLVCDVRDLGFERRISRKLEFRQRRGIVVLGAVLADPLPYLEGEIDSVESGIPFFQNVSYNFV